MRKLAGLATLILAAAPKRSTAQVACPLTLTEAHTSRESVQLTVRNKGKVPVEQFSLSCSPAADRKARSAICLSQAGIFYPGTPYTVQNSYPGADRRSLTVALKTAQLAGGDVWTTRSSDSCHALKINQRP